MNSNVGISGTLSTWQDIQMTSDKLKLVDFSWHFRTCGNDANCLGVVAGYSRNFHFLQKAPESQYGDDPPSLMQRRPQHSGIPGPSSPTLKLSESCVLIEPQDTVIFWICSWNLHVSAKMTSNTETSHLKQCCSRQIDIEASVQPRALELQHRHLWLQFSSFGHRRPA